VVEESLVGGMGRLGGVRIMDLLSNVKRARGTGRVRLVGGIHHTPCRLISISVSLIVV
jgi:hypothetical protein